MILLILNQTIDKVESNLELQHIVVGVMFCANKYDCWNAGWPDLCTQIAS